VIQAEAQTLTASYGEPAASATGELTAAAELVETPVVTVTVEHTHGDGDAQAAHDHEASTPEPTTAAEPTPAAKPKPGVKGQPTGTGAISLERWDGIPGATIEELTAAGAFKAGQPSATSSLERLSYTDGGSDYGLRLRGYLQPAVTGDYRFWIAADDRGALLLSTDAKPANKITIAYTPDWTEEQQWDKFPEQASGSIRLEAGQRYYVEVLYKQGGQKDGFAVAWQPPDRERIIIDGAVLAPYKP
jgi:hypothetical protein